MRTINVFTIENRTAKNLSIFTLILTMFSFLILATYNLSIGHICFISNILNFLLAFYFLYQLIENPIFFRKLFHLKVICYFKNRAL